ncbi:recombination protein NinG [Thauera aromatica]|uniref:recombination protein NinG n=1 Tax=Thauera aromatica TaxID=59405 RepID=UPI001FFD3715|nr:recombination protein NinG [Thauera aromatica]MCK2097533.1 recombination protein NinG [Thauera aromatica]
MLQTTFREKKCRSCRTPFRPWSALQVACSPVCAQALAQRIREKAERRQATVERKQTREALEALKTVPQLIAEADRAFCAFIRARDAGRPCICCGGTAKSTSLTGGEWDAGHYRSRGAASHLRYDERNCHAQLKQCNRRAFDVASYRRNLIARIGQVAVEDLERDNRTRKWSRDELREIRDAYRARLRELLKAQKA